MLIIDNLNLIIEPCKNKIKRFRHQLMDNIAKKIYPLLIYNIYHRILIKSIVKLF